MIILTKEQILILHKLIYERYGGSYGIRDEGLLESALETPFQTYDGQDLYKSEIEKIARLSYGLIGNHPFEDGNKRIGALVLLTLMELNGLELVATDEELTKVIYDVASGSEGMSAGDLYSWVQKHFRCTRKKSIYELTVEDVMNRIPSTCNGLQSQQTTGSKVTD